MCLITAALCEHFLGEPIGLPDPPFFAVLAVSLYALMANVCYTGGWVAEIIAGKLWAEEGEHFGKISFFMGLVFSLLLTAIPGILIAAVGSIRLLAHAISK
jgi:hypothetical protein